MVLAAALGKASGVHLENMIELGNKLGTLDATEDSGEFTKATSQFQAASQIFQESISTMLKSVGEGVSTVARKQ